MSLLFEKNSILEGTFDRPSFDQNNVITFAAPTSGSLSFPSSPGRRHECLFRATPHFWLSETVNDEMADFQLVSLLSSSLPASQKKTCAGFPNFYVVMNLESISA